MFEQGNWLYSGYYEGDGNGDSVPLLWRRSDAQNTQGWLHRTATRGYTDMINIRLGTGAHISPHRGNRKGLDRASVSELGLFQTLDSENRARKASNAAAETERFRAAAGVTCGDGGIV